MYEHCINVERACRQSKKFLGFSEVRWNTSGMTTLNAGHTIIYSGNTNATAGHDKGVGFLLTKNAKQRPKSGEREREIGSNGIGEMNENGEIFADFCAVNSLVIGKQLAKAEAACSKGDTKTLYSITKQLSGKPPTLNTTIKDKDNKTLTTLEEQLESRTEHFEQVLNRPPPTDSPELQIGPTLNTKTRKKPESNGASLLHVARNKEIMEILIEKGINVNGLNSEGLTPLHIATKDGTYKLVDLLIKNKANVNAENKASVITEFDLEINDTPETTT
ncbi:unnamed protein product [Mytilus edulis]|uniref:Uncharacterized protein n=1 Tax=Mytilus edulis TaxID=6550 RepID=A0A8S3T680_MYTED|nr:unnamed protein product [Mytilus edulis]